MECISARTLPALYKKEKGANLLSEQMVVHHLPEPDAAQVTPILGNQPWMKRYNWQAQGPPVTISVPQYGVLELESGLRSAIHT